MIIEEWVMDRWQGRQAVLGGLVIGGLLALGAVMPERVTVPEDAHDVEACMQAGNDWRVCSVNWDAYVAWTSEDGSVGDFGDVEVNREHGGCERRWEDGSVSVVPCDR